MSQLSATNSVIPTKVTCVCVCVFTFLITISIQSQRVCSVLQICITLRVVSSGWTMLTAKETRVVYWSVHMVLLGNTTVQIKNLLELAVKSQVCTYYHEHWQQSFLKSLPVKPSTL